MVVADGFRLPAAVVLVKVQVDPPSLEVALKPQDQETFATGTKIAAAVEG